MPQPLVNDSYRKRVVKRKVIPITKNGQTEFITKGGSGGTSWASCNFPMKKVKNKVRELTHDEFQELGPRNMEEYYTEHPWLRMGGGNSNSVKEPTFWNLFNATTVKESGFIPALTSAVQQEGLNAYGAAVASGTSAQGGLTALAVQQMAGQEVVTMTGKTILIGTPGSTIAMESLVLAPAIVGVAAAGGYAYYQESTPLQFTSGKGSGNYGIYRPSGAAMPKFTQFKGPCSNDDNDQPLDGDF